LVVVERGEISPKYPSRSGPKCTKYTLMGHGVLGAIRGKKEGRGKRMSEAGDSQTLNSKAVFLV